MIPPLPRPLRDFRNMVQRVWDCLGLPEPTRAQYSAAHFMQHGPPHRILEAYRGFGKSYLADCYVAWRHRVRLDEVGHTDLNSLMISAGKDLSDTNSNFVFKLMEVVPEFQCLLPGANQLCSTVKFDMGPKGSVKDPSVKAMGIFGQLTGSRGDDLVVDDVEVPNTAATVGMRLRLRRRVEELHDLGKRGQEANILVLGTPQTEDTIYDALALLGYERWIWPARYPDEREQERMGEGLAPELREDLLKDPSLVGKPTDPDRVGEDELLEWEAKDGRSRFAMQALLNPLGMDREKRPLRLTDLIVDDVDAEMAYEKVVWSSATKDLAWVDIPCFGVSGDRYLRPINRVGQQLPYAGAVMYIDPAGRGKDETAYAVGKILNGTIHVPDFGGYIGGFENSTLEGLAKAAKKYKVNQILVEKNFGGGMFTQLLMPYLRDIEYRCSIDEVHNTVQKERRICDTLEPLMGQHRLVVDAGALRRDAEPRPGMSDEAAMQYRLAFQLSRITREKGCLGKDDRVDALAGVCAHFVEVISRSADEAMRARQDELWEKELRDWPDPNQPTRPGSLAGYIPNHMRR